MLNQTKHFEVGALYLFHTYSPQCPGETSLWGVFIDRPDDKTVRLGAFTRNLRKFILLRDLPVGYRYCRPATQGEQRLFTSGLVAALRSVRQSEQDA